MSGIDTVYGVWATNIYAIQGPHNDLKAFNNVHLYCARWHLDTADLRKLDVPYFQCYAFVMSLYYEIFLNED